MFSSRNERSRKVFEAKSIIIATYILCGFANFSVNRIQIGGIGAIVLKRKGDLAKLGILALIGVLLLHYLQQWLSELSYKWKNYTYTIFYLSVFWQQTVKDSIIHDNVYRSYRAYIPAIYNSSKATPLLFNFHGLTGSSTSMWQADFQINSWYSKFYYCSSTRFIK